MALLNRFFAAIVVTAGLSGQPVSVATAAQGPSKPPAESFEEPHGADLNEGKPPAQIFSSDCGVCHKSPQGLVKDRSVGALTNFLRQHYTTGAPQASSLAAYLTSLPAGARQPAATPTRASPGDRPERAAPAASGRRPPLPVGQESAPSQDGLPNPGEGRHKPGMRNAKPKDEAPEKDKKKREPKSREAAKPPETKPAPGARDRRAPKSQDIAKPEVKPETKPEMKPQEPDKAAASPAHASPPASAEAPKIAAPASPPAASSPQPEAKPTPKSAAPEIPL